MKREVSGVTLLSLLIGIALGTFLIIVILQIFSATRANYQLSKNLDEMDSIVRYTAIVMNDVITQAGYMTPAASTGLLPAYTTAFVPFGGALYGPTGSAYTTQGYPNSDDPAGVVISYYPGENVFLNAIDPNNEDKLWVKFEGDPNGEIRECNDLYGIANTAIKVLFYSETSSIGNSTTQAQAAYYCQRINYGETYAYSDQPSGQILIPAGIFDQAFVRFGEDITGNGFIDRWASGSDVINRNQVYAVRIGFLVHTRDQVRSAPVTQSFYVFDQTVSYTDQYIHRLYMFTILLPYAPNFDLLSVVGSP